MFGDDPLNKDAIPEDEKIYLPLKVSGHDF